MKTLKTIVVAALILPLLTLGCSKASDSQNPALTHPLAVAYPELVGQAFISTTCDKSLVPGRSSKIEYDFQRDQFREKIHYYTDVGCSQEDLTVIYWGKVNISKAVDNPEARSVDLIYSKALLKVLSPDVSLGLNRGFD